MHRDDRHLLMLMHRGDEAAARLLWERHAPIMRRYAASLLHGDDHLAGDVTSDVMMHVLTLKRPQIEAVQDVAAWFVASCRRRSITLIRASRRRRNREATFSRRFGQAPDATDRTDLATLANLIDALPHRLREPVMLHDLCGLTFEQASLATGIPRATLADRHRAAMRSLRASMGDLVMPHATKGGTR
jgi:RNA polymerase sigma factor (sigma-70 family)